ISAFQRSRLRSRQYEAREVPRPIRSRCRTEIASPSARTRKAPNSPFTNREYDEWIVTTSWRTRLSRARFALREVAVLAHQKPDQAIRLLGELGIRGNGKWVELPASKKTRALLGYLIVSRRSHTRDQLCELLWDIPDDPRAALRWSLTKIRPLVDRGTTI